MTFFKTDQCDICMVSKSTRLTFGDTPIRSSKPRELLQSDIVGPLVQNKGGMQYYATSVDDYTGVISIFLLKTKDEVNEKII